MERKFLIGTSDLRFLQLQEQFERCDYKENIAFINTTRNINSILLKALRKIHLSKKVNKIIDLPFKHIWGSTFDDIINDTNVEYYVVFMAPAIFPMDPSYLLELQKKYKVHYILYFADHVASYWSAYALKCLSVLKFDYIFTFDNDDAVKYNYIHYIFPYKMPLDNICKEVNYDLYFIGGNKNRLNNLHRLYGFLKSRGVLMNFRIVDVSTKEQKYKSEIKYNERIKYPEVVEEVKKSNCILDIPTEGQSGVSIRYYEAVCYNKKLLTKNKNIVNMPFYDPRYMKVFENPEDIDIEWVKRREEIDYHYDGCFSPTHFIDKIIELEEEKKKEG